VVARLAECEGELRMSTVNLTEVLILLRDRQPQLADELEVRLLDSGIRFVPPDADQARTVAAARLRYPLNLGDCFAYALAVSERCPILTLDADFRRVDVEVVLPP
jgi:ribonuclease VapC